jgi:hypothetical protein
MGEKHRDEEWGRLSWPWQAAAFGLFKSRARGLNPLLVLTAMILALLVAAWAIYLNHAS